MSWLNEQWQRVKHLVRPGRFDEDLAEEMRLHLELRTAENPQARANFGNLTRLREDSRNAWRFPTFDSIVQDVRYGVRTLAASPAFTLTAILSLTLAIGANTAIFSLLNAIMLRTLPVRDPTRLVTIQHGKSPSFTNPLWEQIRDHPQPFDGLLAYGSEQFDLTSGGERQYAQGLMVSGNFFQTLGVPALRGRLLTTEDDHHGCGPNGPLAVISQRFWQSHFDSDPSVVGRELTLDLVKFRVAGVTPAWFTGLSKDSSYDVAVPIGCEPLFHTDRSALGERSWWWLRILGRLKPGVTLQATTAQLDALASAIMQATVPPNYKADGQKEYLQRRLTLQPASTGFSGLGQAYGKALLTLQAVVAIVLLIACANVGNLLLARATARQRELSVRLAIGAGRLRILRQLLTESLLLACLGATGGLVLASWGTRLLIYLLKTSNGLGGSQRYEVDLDASLDMTVIGFTALVVLLTTLFFGLLPALRASATTPNTVLKEQARGNLAGGGGRFSLANLMVAVQIGLALTLLSAAALFGESFRRILRVDAGFDVSNVVLISAEIPQALVAKGQRFQVFNEGLERLRQIPGVVAASRSDLSPVSNSAWNEDVFPAGYQSTGVQGDRLLYFNRASPGYFQTLGAKLIAGRDFDARDRLGAPRVVIIGETTARAFWGIGNPLGRTIGIESHDGKNQQEVYQVIGVVKDMKYESLSEVTLKTAFLAAAQEAEPRNHTEYELRLDAMSSVNRVLPLARQALVATNKNVSLEIKSFDSQIGNSLIQPRLIAAVSGFFGAVALLLAATGLYGVIAYSTARRKGEIGLRMALGASYSSVLWLVLKDMGVTLTCGAAFGLTAAYFAARLVSSLIFGVQPTDPAVLGAALAALIVTASIAAYLPARRAALLDPMDSLRME